ncbi:hypothetical protein Zm00014a_034200 [Zea mays]|uniref:Uncharacterized protein n=1 Tax=Zea mays TaxID=4577 RepID=A0A3L6ECS0_MAIZE|nr:hypothetical protein Zm00014a_034200 [Zea mays]
MFCWLGVCECRANQC